MLATMEAVSNCNQLYGRMQFRNWHDALVRVPFQKNWTILETAVAGDPAAARTGARNGRGVRPLHRGTAGLLAAFPIGQASRCWRRAGGIELLFEILDVGIDELPDFGDLHS